MLLCIYSGAQPGTRASVTQRAGAPIRGLDISAYQHAGSPIHWAKLATHGIRFVAIKASEGTYYLNPYYASDARAAAAAGLRVMPYVFANPGRSGGVTTALTVGSLIALTGAVIAFFGLRGFRPVNAPQGQAAPAVALEG